MRKFEKLASHIPSLYAPFVNRFIRGILEAWGTGDDDIQTAIEATRDQLFVSTASQQFLDQLASNVGVVRPASIGISDDNFRDLIPTLSYVPKQLRESIWKLLEIFYKTESVYANFTSVMPEPYALIANDTLTVIVDRINQVDLIFQASDFTDINNATALEVANSINKQAFDAGIVADVYTDVITHDSFVRIRTATPGPSGEVRLRGGSSQNVLQFPQKLNTTQDIGTEWTITPVAGDTVQIAYTGATGGVLDPTLSLVSSGDIIILEGTGAGGPFNDLNAGSYVIDGVVLGTPPYVEVTLHGATGETVTQINPLDVAFYYPKRYDTTQLPRPAVMYEVNHKELTIAIPSTVAIIDRLDKGVAHIHPNTYGDVMFLRNHSGLELRKGDTLRGIDAMYLTAGTGAFEPGETIQGGTGPTATAMHIIKADSVETILGLTNVTGGAFSLGMVVTGLTSGATGGFERLVSTLGGTAYVDHILDIDSKVAVSGFPTGTIPFSVSPITGDGEGLVGRTTIRLEFADADFDVGEKLSSVRTLTLTGPFSAIPFQVGETLTTTYAIGALVTGDISGATGYVQSYVTPVTFAAGEEPIVSKDDFFSTGNTVIQTYNNTVRLPVGGTIVGATSGSKGVITQIESSLFTYGSMEVETTSNGPYIFDTAANFTAGSDYGTLNQAILPGAPLTILALTGMTSTFPVGPGYFIIEYGLGNQEGPIRYTSKPNSGSLIIDPSFVFQKAHAVGANVRYVNSLEATDPRQTGGDYATYVTGLAPARVILQDLVRQAVAAGIVVRFIVGFPEYRFTSYETNDTV